MAPPPRLMAVRIDEDGAVSPAPSRRRATHCAMSREDFSAALLAYHLEFEESADGDGMVGIYT